MEKWCGKSVVRTFCGYAMNIPHLTLKCILHFKHNLPVCFMGSLQTRKSRILPKTHTHTQNHHCGAVCSKNIAEQMLKPKYFLT